jgi:hypothetical protein
MLPIFNGIVPAGVRIPVNQLRAMNLGTASSPGLRLPLLPKKEEGWGEEAIRALGEEPLSVYGEGERKYN